MGGKACDAKVQDVVQGNTYQSPPGSAPERGVLALLPAAAEEYVGAMESVEEAAVELVVRRSRVEQF